MWYLLIFSHVHIKFTLDLFRSFLFAKSCLHLYLILYFNFIHPIKNIFFDNIDYIRKLDASGKARPCILDNVERSLLCHTCYLGFDQFECTDCDNMNIIPHSCHSRFCNARGVKYAKQLAAKATTVLIDTLYLLFPKNLETGSDRIVLDSIFCLLLLETQFLFLPKNLLPINSKKIIGYPLYIQRYSGTMSRKRTPKIDKF